MIIKAKNEITLVRVNDGAQGPQGIPGKDGVIASNSAPSDKTKVWLDTSKKPPILKRWDGSKWEVVNDVQIGGKNYLLDSNVEHTNNDYLVNYYTPSEPLVEGETYTISMCVTPAPNVTFFGVFVSGGYSMPGRLTHTGTGKQILTKTFKMAYAVGKDPSVDIKFANVGIFRFPNDGTVTQPSTIHWIKIEKGNKATDYTPAPEDIENKVDNIQIGGRNYANDRDYTRDDEYHTIVKAQETFNNRVVWKAVKKSNTMAMIMPLKEYIYIEPGETYTASVWVKYEKITANASEILFYSPDDTSLDKGRFDPDKTIGKWHRFEFSHTNNTANTVKFDVWFYVATNAQDVTYFSSFKVEKGSKATDWTPNPDDMATQDEIVELESRVVKQKEETTNGYTSYVGENYYKKGDVDNLLASVSTLIKQEKDNITIDFNTFKKAVAGNQSGNAAQFEEIKKYISFVDGNIILGVHDNPCQLKIENNRISFLEKGVEVAHITGQKLYITDGEFINSVQIGNFAFIPRANGNLSFKKVVKR